MRPSVAGHLFQLGRGVTGQYHDYPAARGVRQQLALAGAALRGVRGHGRGGAGGGAPEGGAHRALRVQT